MSKNCDFRRNRCSEGHKSLDSVKQILHALSKFLSIAINSIEVISTTIDLLIVSFVKIGVVEAILCWKIYFTGRHTLLEDILYCKTYFTGSHTLLEDILYWKIYFTG